MWACMGSIMFLAEITPINNHGNGLSRPQRAEWITCVHFLGVGLHFTTVVLWESLTKLENNRF